MEPATQFKIIGADRQPYGPVSLEVLRRWLRENRANAQTLVWREGAPDWQPLGTLPEFAAELRPPLAAPPPLPLAPVAKSRVIAGLLGLFFGGFGVHRFYLGYSGLGVVQILVTVCTCGLGALWGFIEGIQILTETCGWTDAAGRPLQE